MAAQRIQLELHLVEIARRRERRDRRNREHRSGDDSFPAEPRKHSIPKRGRRASTWPTASPRASPRTCSWRRPGFCSRSVARSPPGWTLLSISTISSGLPFTIYSGIQQTAAGAGGVDRPNQIAVPHLSTARKVREDYFGEGRQQCVVLLDSHQCARRHGAEPGIFGTLGRNTFRGPAYYDFDFSLIKDTPVGRRSNGGELFDVQFRSEFFNLFNIVEHGVAGEHDPRLRIRPDQQDRGDIEADSVFAEDTVLKAEECGR
jgi:hypothetical protein